VPLIQKASQTVRRCLSDVGSMSAGSTTNPATSRYAHCMHTVSKGSHSVSDRLIIWFLNDHQYKHLLTAVSASRKAAGKVPDMSVVKHGCLVPFKHRQAAESAQINRSRARCAARGIIMGCVYVHVD
jgi:hypothetical protein